MTSVDGWRQEGGLRVWRYAALGRSRRGWHISADRSGCASIIDLVDRMIAEAAPAYRTMKLDPVTRDIWDVPNFGPPKRDRFDRLRIEYRPDQETLSLEPADDRLILGLGAIRAPLLRAGFVELMLGKNDFGIAPSDDERAEPWMFW